MHAIVESVWCSSGGSSIVRDLELAYRSLLRGGGGEGEKSGNNLESGGNKERIFFSFFLSSFLFFKRLVTLGRYLCRVLPSFSDPASADKTVFSWKTNYSKLLYSNPPPRMHVPCVIFLLAEVRERKASDVSRSREIYAIIRVHIGWEGTACTACTKGKKKRGRTKAELFDGRVSFDTATTRN